MKKITRIEATAAAPVMGKTRVAAYCRVSTGEDGQLVSLETQKSHYEEFITSNPDRAFAGLYYDEGISGTSKEKRTALMQMIADCEAGKIYREYLEGRSYYDIGKGLTADGIKTAAGSERWHPLYGRYSGTRNTSEMPFCRRRSPRTF